MTTKVDIRKEMYGWALARAGLTMAAYPPRKKISIFLPSG